ncbi:UNVERIFIED_CONTAM: hypothetical protein RMT77_011984 [Armadillidium vulgare]
MKLKQHLFSIFFIGIISKVYYGNSMWQNNILPTRESFTIDRESKSFLKDGHPFRYISGTIHYFRVLPDSWRDRMRKLRHAGCNVLQTYVEWSSHEPEPGEYNFKGRFNLFQYLNIAHEEGLLVILRPGPYIDAERDMGGLPYWLLRENPTVRLRTMDNKYLKYVERWFRMLLPLLKPYLYINGGPIIMMQVENEYGSYRACDFRYTSYLRDLTRKLLGDELLLFTTDGASTGFLKCGKIPQVYATVDFPPGRNVTECFSAQRLFEPNGPLVNSEFYPGWLDHWGAPHSKRSSKEVTQALDEILSLNASVNIYVFNGGTSFGLSSGSNMGDKFQACPTSYDFDAPLNEAGDPTEKYYAIRNVIKKYVKLPPGPVPGPSPKYAYGDVQVHPKAELLSLSGYLKSFTSTWPLTFEELSVFSGLVVYTTKIPKMISDPARLSLYDIHDRGYVYIDNEFAGIVSREQKLYELPISAKPNQDLVIVVESQGRICYGENINDFKGITTNVTIGETHKLSKWEMTPVPLTNLTELRQIIEYSQQKTLNQVRNSNSGGMTFYEGKFSVPKDSGSPKDTFLRLDGWTKGYAWINDFLLGRYWPAVGPQVTLYIPSGLLHFDDNKILLLELEKAPCKENSSCNVSLVDIPEVNGPTPEW